MSDTKSSNLSEAHQRLAKRVAEAQLSVTTAAVVLTQSLGLSEDKAAYVMKVLLNCYSLGFKDGERGAIEHETEMKHAAIIDGAPHGANH